MSARHITEHEFLHAVPLLPMLNIRPTDPKLASHHHQLAASGPVDFKFVVAVIWLSLVLTLHVVVTYAEYFPAVPTLGLHLAIGSPSHKRLPRDRNRFSIKSEPHAGEKFQVKVKTPVRPPRGNSLGA